MNYITWGNIVFDTIVKGYADAQNPYGLNIDAIAEHLHLIDDASGPVTTALANAREDLYALELIEASSVYANRMNKVVPYRPTRLGKRIHHEGLSKLWERIASIYVSDAGQQFLARLAELSLKEYENCANVVPVSVEDVSTALGWSDDHQVHQVIEDLVGDELVADFAFDDLRLTYQGAVWVEQNLAGWHKRWKPADGATYSAGGQGKVIKVVERIGTRVGAYKELHPEHLRNTERRKRMRREVDILERLDIDGVPKVLEHNIDQVENVGTPLYLITDWVEGETLEKRVNGRPEVLDSALVIARDAARILQACHAAKVLHRDIKADNVMVSRDSGKVHIIDFGIAWTRPDPGVPDIKTKNQQDLRNRWFSIPDLAAGRLRQDPRTDITQLLGVLIYMLTGQAPKVLTDEQGRPPHKALLGELPKTTRLDSRWYRLEQIFDRGFRPNIGERFQSFDDLIPLLDGLIGADTGPSEGEVASLYARWERERDELEQVIRESISNPPVEPTEGYAFLNVFVAPSLADTDLLSRALKGQSEHELFKGLLRVACQDTVFPRKPNMYPDFAYPHARQLRHIDGWVICVKDYPQLMSKDKRSPDNVLDIEFRDTGTGWLFCGSAAKRGPDGTYWLKEDVIAGLTTRFLYAMGALYDRAEYIGDVRMAVVITNLRGVESPNVKRGAGIIGEPPPPYERAEYRHQTRASATDLKSVEKCRQRAAELIMLLIKAVS
jgi:serine/threonine protein kinase